MEVLGLLVALSVAAAMFALSRRAHRRQVKRLETTPQPSDDDPPDSLDTWNQMAATLELVPFKDTDGVRRAPGYSGVLEALPTQLRLADQSQKGHYRIHIDFELPFPWNALEVTDADVVPFGGLRDEVSLSADKSLTDVQLCEESRSRFRQLAENHWVSELTVHQQKLRVTTNWWDPHQNSLPEMLRTLARRGVKHALQSGVQATVNTRAVDMEIELFIRVTDSEADVVSYVEIHFPLSAQWAQQIAIRPSDDFEPTASARQAEEIFEKRFTLESPDHHNGSVNDRAQQLLSSLADNFHSVRLEYGKLVVGEPLDAYDAQVAEQFERIDEIIERAGGIALELDQCSIAEK